MKQLKVMSGFALILVGIVMLVTPGPGMLAVFAGISILASKYEWARRWRDRLRHLTHRVSLRRAA